MHHDTAFSKDTSPAVERFFKVQVQRVLSSTQELVLRTFNLLPLWPEIIKV